MRMLVIGAITALFGLVALGYNAFTTNLSSLKQLNQESLVWTSDQLKFELSALTRELAKLDVGFEGTSPASVNTRFDIIWSRVAQSEKGSLGARLRAYDEEAGILPSLLTLLREVEADVVNLNADDSATIQTLIGRFEAMQRPIFDFDRKVFLGEEALVAEIRAQLWTSAMFTAIVTMAAFMLTSGALLWVSRENAKNKQMAEHNLELAEEADKANQAKSRFLTMMSHELRTPMNGVLGMISLAKQPGMAMPQLRLIEQAEKSGKQMISMLSDILDYAALQDKEMELDQKPFAVIGLASAVRELFGSVARREGISFDVVVDDKCPDRLTGDIKRLRQIVAHFASYIVEMAGTDNVEIRIGHSKDALRVSINFDYGASAPDQAWRPEILLGVNNDDPTQFASDALGPAVARGILAQMGGSVHLGHAQGNRISVILKAPAREVVLDEILIHTETNSAALRTICEVGLSGTKAKIVPKDYQGTVDMVLMECGGLDEMERVQVLAAKHRNALLIALGDPINPSDFDDRITLPINIEDLRISVLEQAAI